MSETKGKYMITRPPKKSLSVRLSAYAQEALENVVRRTGQSQSTVIEIALLEYAKQVLRVDPSKHPEIVREAFEGMSIEEIERTLYILWLLGDRHSFCWLDQRELIHERARTIHDLLHE